MFFRLTAKRYTIYLRIFDKNSRMTKYWSKKVTEESNVLDLEHGVFTWEDPKKIARSLANSAKQSARRKGTPLQSAMSMLNFYINRAGRNLPQGQKKILKEAKGALRKLYNY